MYQFNYLRPKSLDDARKLFESNGDAKFLAGGQTLIPTLKQRLAQPTALIDLGAISGLAGIKVAGGAVVIGAGTKHNDVAIVRLEQLYPLSDETIAAALKPYADGTPVIWVQEEPENMGAWRHLLVRFGDQLLGRWPFRGVCRHTASSPASGSFTRHKLEQAGLIGEAFAL